MRLIFVLVLLSSLAVSGQNKRFVIGPKGDTLNRIDQNGKKQGPWVIHLDDNHGEPGYEEEGYFINDKRDGTWRRFSLQGDMIAVENYRWGSKDGKSQYYTNMGDLEHEESWKAVNPDNPYDTIHVYDLIDPTKIVGTQIVKLEGYSLKHGTWRYFDPNSGTVEKTEKWFLDKPAEGNSNNGDELKPIDIAANTGSKSDTAAKKPASKPQAILDYEKKNSGKKKMKVRDGNTGY